METNNTRLPVFFFGHGSPMNALGDNEFTRTWSESVRDLPIPKAVICISAHWETGGTLITAMEKPRTIHDFAGFPPRLHNISYPAPGDPSLARELADTVNKAGVKPDYSWGLDHGCWSVIKFLYPDANVPVLQLSLNYNKKPSEHIEIARELSTFRDRGVLITGSGNIVHNLGAIDWSNPDGGYDWALEASESLKQIITSGNIDKLADYRSLGREVSMSIPTPEHFLPLLYALALKNENESISFMNDKVIMGSLSMTSLRIG